jgi:hypothetical protein
MEKPQEERPKLNVYKTKDQQNSIRQSESLKLLRQTREKEVLEKLKQSKEKMKERGEKLNELEEKTKKMSHQSFRFLEKCRKMNGKFTTSATVVGEMEKESGNRAENTANKGLRNKFKKLIFFRFNIFIAFLSR